MARLKVRGRDVAHLYHLTSTANVASIAEDGLDPARCREPPFRSRGVYLALDAAHALGYADHHGDWEGGTLLRVSVAGLDAAAFEPDDVDLPDLTERGVTWQRGLVLSGQCKFTATIGPEHVEARVDGTWRPLVDVAVRPTP